MVEKWMPPLNLKLYKTGNNQYILKKILKKLGPAFKHILNARRSELEQSEEYNDDSNDSDNQEDDE